jgi:hypothetical protein
MPRQELPDVILRQGQESPFSYQFPTPRRVIDVVLAEGLELGKLVLADVAGKPRKEWAGDQIAGKEYAKTRFYPSQDSFQLVIKNVADDDRVVQGFFEWEEAPLPGSPPLPRALERETSPGELDSQDELGDPAFGAGAEAGGEYDEGAAEDDGGYAAPAAPRALAPFAQGPSDAEVHVAERIIRARAQAVRAAAQAPRLPKPVQAPVQPVMGHVQTTPGPAGYAQARARAAAQARGAKVPVQHVQGRTNGHQVRTGVVGVPGHNQVSVLVTFGQAERLLRVCKGHFVSQIELIDIIGPLERSLEA